ncbi:MAG: ribosome silencing factor [Candidatus Coatesbacteria bacterium]|nr:ribosome silencing factor [Candidatus Coatesbacteria bacterium]
MKTEEIENVIVLSNLAIEKKAMDLNVIDLREMEYVTDFFIIATGFNEVHIQAIADHILRLTKGTIYKPWHKEGITPGSTWVCLDFGDIVFHIMSKEKRNYYNLESLWHDAPQIDILPIIAGMEKGKIPLSLSVSSEEPEKGVASPDKEND